VIRGKTKNIALTPQAMKDLKPEETFSPVHIDLRNGHMSDAGVWIKRPGSSVEWNIGSNDRVPLLIPSGLGYAVSSAGRVYRLETSLSDITGTILDGESEVPTWVNYNGTIVITNGRYPIKINNATTEPLAGNPPMAKFVDTIDTYLILCGSGPTWYWSDVGNFEKYTRVDGYIVNKNSILKEGESIVMMKVYNREIFFFKDYSIETWINIGGTTTFARRTAIDLADTRYRGGRGIVGSSVVQANNTFHFYADGDFYRLNGTTPEIISPQYSSEIRKVKITGNIIGLDCRKEHIIRWMSQSDGRCFVYDYKHNVFSEDNTWDHGQWERLPFMSYMEFNGEQYFGSYDNDGKIYHWSDEYGDDSGKQINVHRDLAYRMSENGFGGRANRLRFWFKAGVGTPTVTDPRIIVKWRFDRTNVWESEEVSLGDVGEHYPYADIFSLGVGNEMNLVISETDAVPYVLTGALLTVEPLGT